MNSRAEGWTSSRKQWIELDTGRIAVGHIVRADHNRRAEDAYPIGGTGRRQHQRAAGCIRKVIMTSERVVDHLTAAARLPALQAAQLASELGVVQ